MPIISLQTQNTIMWKFPMQEKMFGLRKTKKSYKNDLHHGIMIVKLFQ